MEKQFALQVTLFCICHFPPATAVMISDDEQALLLLLHNVNQLVRVHGLIAFVNFTLAGGMTIHLTQVELFLV